MKYDQNFLYNLSSKLFDNLNSLLSKLEVDLNKYGNKWTGVCPCHEGADNPTALSIRNGTWICYTHHCEHIFFKSIIGFTRGVLSNKNGSMISFNSTLRWIFDFLGIDGKAISSYNTGQNTDILFRKRNINESQLTREQVRQRLTFPAEFLIKRGFDKDLLNAYDIGICYKKGKDMAGRAVLPIFSDCGRYMVGCLGRTINELCSKCNLYHFGECPQFGGKKFHKWINSKGFYADSYLYNYWNAQKSIRKEKRVILVEGPLDCLKLVQAGKENVVALFGNNISEQQCILLERFPLQEIQIMLDNDNSGHLGKKQIQEECGYLCKTIDIDYAKKDPGELTDKEIGELKI